MLEIGIVGTFDVQNFGDLLFPIVAEQELERRLGPINLHRFSYHTKGPPDWPFSVSTVAELPARVPKLNGLLVGGGHIIRFDKSIAPGYLPPAENIHHPTGYWLMPALYALYQGCPVVWNCPSASTAIPAWSEPLMRTAFGNSSYIAVRDGSTRDTLLKFASDISIVPDTCFGISRLIDQQNPSARCLKLREAVGLKKPYIVVQATGRVTGFANFVRRNSEQFAAYQFVSLPIGPALGDSNFSIAGQFEGLVSLASWPDPLLLAELIAGASCVVGGSLHLAIVALSFGIHAFRFGNEFGGKFAILAPYETVHCFQDDGDVDPAWFRQQLAKRGPSPAIQDALKALDLHWDRVAQCFSATTEKIIPMDAFGLLMQSLPGLLENEERLLEEIVQSRELFDTHRLAVSVRDDEISARDKIIAARNAELADLNAVIEARDREVSALRLSTSWRITAGLRAIKTIARAGKTESRLSGPPQSVLERHDAIDPSDRLFPRVMEILENTRKVGARPQETVAQLLKAETETAGQRARPSAAPKLSVVLVGFNMARELPRTIRSLSPDMQRGIDADDYEVILIDNGSTQDTDETELRRLLPNLVMRRLPNATVSPVPAINFGLTLARGDLIGVCIDGARMASPGLLAAALAASRLHARPMIGTLAFHLGPEVQMESVKHGYDQAAEDALLAQSGWENDGYRLFSISSFAGSSAGGWFELPAESNAVFLRAGHWRDLGGWDERFETPGGGLANLDVWSRICADTDGELIMLLGEATFHQVHGGIATNNPNAPQALFHEEYLRIRGRPYARPTRRPLYFGSIPDTTKPGLKLSVDRM